MTVVRLRGYEGNVNLSALLLILVSVTFQASASSQFESEMRPGEGLPRFQATTTELILRMEPSSSAEIGQRLSVAVGQEIEYDQTRYRTIKPGRLQAKTPAILRGRVLGSIQYLSRESYYRGAFPRDDLSVSQGESIEYLQYRAEGTCFIRVHGQVMDANPCPVGDGMGGNSDWKAICQPEIEWWIRVITANGAGAGWLLIEPSSVVKEFDRRF